MPQAVSSGTRGAKTKAVTSHRTPRLGCGSARGLFVLGLLLTTAWPVRGEVTAEQVREALQNGSKYLKSQQGKVKGGWNERPIQPGGVTAWRRK